MNTIVDITALRKSYGTNEVLKGIDLKVAAGEVIAIIGKSGSGKSTLLRCINGLEEFQDGALSVDGKKLLYDSPSAMRELRQRVGMIFQSFNLFPHLTVGKNIMLAPSLVKKTDATTADAHIALWRALLGLDLLDAVTITTHPRDPLPYLLTDPRQVRTTEVADGMWLRLVDPIAALQARRYGADVCVTLGLGAQRFRFEVRDGRARCTPTDQPPDVQTDGEVLAGLYLGAHRATEFAAAGRLRCTDPALPGRLDAVFASPVPAEAGYEL